MSEENSDGDTLSKYIYPSKLACEVDFEDVAKHFKVSIENGLKKSTVEKTLKKAGENALEEEEPQSLFSMFIEQFKEPLVMLLLGSAGISFLMGQIEDGMSITLAVIIVCTVAFIQNYRSEKALESLRSLVQHKCRVRRDGKPKEITAVNVVPGDVILLATGDRVPCDIRLTESIRLQINESVLTGEGEPVSKQSNVCSLEDNTSLADRINIGYMGTLVTSGRGVGIAITTGVHTELGIISQMLKEVEDKETPLQKSMSELGKQLSIFSFGIIFIIFIFGVVNGKSWFDMFNISVSLAVAAIPEGLPIVVTVTLAMGVMRMADRHAIVRKLPSVETLGAANVVCADKTGTLTKNQMTVTKIFSLTNGIVEVTGLGYKTKGKLKSNGTTLDLVKGKHKNLSSIIEIGVLCNNAKVNKEKLIGVPTEGSLIVLGKKVKLFKQINETWKRTDEIPFSSKAKWMAVKCKSENQEKYFVKGALERLEKKMKKCMVKEGEEEKEVDMTDDLQNEINQAQEKLAGKALRVLALCTGNENENQLCFRGLVGIVDPPRENVGDAVMRLQKSQIRTIMITGDSKPTAIAIAKKLNIFNEMYPLALTAVDLEKEDFEETIKKASVFYRMSPKHKMTIIGALQKNGDIVAMTGDGVNDAVALKKADIGIAMGSGTDVCKEAAEMVLLDDDFSTIMAAIEEGKSIWSNIKNFLRFQLTTSIAALSIVALTNLLDFPAPLNPMQILWINIIMDGPPAQALGVEPVDEDLMKLPPRDTTKSIISRKMIINVGTNALVMLVGTLFIFIREVQDGNVTNRDSTMTFTTFIMFQMFNAMNCRSETKSLFKIGIFANTPLFIAIVLSLVGQLLMIYVPFMEFIFETEPIWFADWMMIIMVSSTILIGEETLKFIASLPRLRLVID